MEKRKRLASGSYEIGKWTIVRGEGETTKGEWIAYLAGTCIVLDPFPTLSMATKSVLECIKHGFG